MGYIRPYKDGYRAEVEKLGVRRSATWNTKQEAQSWIRMVEAEIEAGQIVSDSKSFKAAAEKYELEVSSKKKGKDWESLRLKKLVEFFGDKKMENIDAPDIAKWRDSRLNEVSSATVLREKNVLSNLFKIARKEWKWIKHDPFVDVKMPKEPEPRSARWRWQQIKSVVRFLGYKTGEKPKNKQQEVALAFLISLRTGLRSSEVLQVSPSTLNGRVISLTNTKTRSKAEIPITKQARRLCLITTKWSIDAASRDALFRKARDARMIGDLTFHDARATGLTLLAKKVDVIILSKISQHKDLRMLSEVYYRNTAAEMAAQF